MEEWPAGYGLKSLVEVQEHCRSVVVMESQREDHGNGLLYIARVLPVEPYLILRASVIKQLFDSNKAELPVPPDVFREVQCQWWADAVPKKSQSSQQWNHAPVPEQPAGQVQCACCQDKRSPRRENVTHEQYWLSPAHNRFRSFNLVS